MLFEIVVVYGPFHPIITYVRVSVVKKSSTSLNR